MSRSNESAAVDSDWGILNLTEAPAPSTDLVPVYEAALPRVAGPEPERHMLDIPGRGLVPATVYPPSAEYPDGYALEITAEEEAKDLTQTYGHTSQLFSGPQSGSQERIKGEIRTTPGGGFSFKGELEPNQWADVVAGTMVMAAGRGSAPAPTDVNQPAAGYAGGTAPAQQRSNPALTPGAPYGAETQGPEDTAYGYGEDGQEYEYGEPEPVEVVSGLAAKRARMGQFFKDHPRLTKALLTYATVSTTFNIMDGRVALNPLSDVMHPIAVVKAEVTGGYDFLPTGKKAGLRVVHDAENIWHIVTWPFRAPGEIKHEIGKIPGL